MSGVPDEIHVVVARLDRLSDREVARLVASCNPAERKRAARLPTVATARGFLLARGVLRTLVADAVGSTPAAVPLHRDIGGKWRLPGSGLEFNLSHSRDVSVYALAWGREVGIDVEAIDTRLDIEAIARRFFPAAESTALRTTGSSARHDRFFRGWCRREALLKAQGTGLRRGLAEITTPPVASPLAAPAPFPLESDWSVVDLDLVPGYAAALVSSGVGWEPRVRMYHGGMRGAPTSSGVRLGRADIEEI